MGQTDRWASWLAGFRSGGDQETRRRGFERLAGWRDRILDNAGLEEGETLLDVGCGEGLVAFGAFERGAGTVVFSDISQDLLDFCRTAARELEVLDQSRFVRAAADDLGAIEDASIDVVTTRSVLIYVDDKASAFREFFRVLRPRGRISLFEPINRFARTEADSWMGYDLAPVGAIARKLRNVYEEIQPPESDPMLDFDERDLLELSERAGFFPTRLHLEAEVKPSEPLSWETFVNTPGNPRIPSLAEAIEQTLTPAERARFTRHLQPLVEEGRGVSRTALAYLRGVKP